MSHDNVTQCIKKLQNAVKCVICLETLKKPVTTKCGHNFCSLCINQALRSHSPLPCPLCKAPITRRNLRSSNYFQDVVAAVSRLSSAAVKEIVGTELELLSSSKTPKNALRESKETKKTPILTKDRRISSRSLFNTPGNEKTSTVGKVLNVDEQHLDSTPDMLDMINVEAKLSSIKTPSFGNSAQSSTASHPNISLLNKSDSTPAKDSSTTEIDDPFQFPVSQKQTTSPPKGKRRPSRRKSISKQRNVAKNNSGPQNASKVRQAKTRGTFSAPPDKSPIDKKLIEAILNTEDHSLTIEGKVLRKRNSDQPKKTTTTPDSVAEHQVQLKTKEGRETPNSKIKTGSSSTKTTTVARNVTTSDNKPSAEAQIQEKVSLVNKATGKDLVENISIEQACKPIETIANHHQLGNCPMSDTSSSICTEAAAKVKEPVKTTQEIAVDLEDKVQTWLHSVVSPEKFEEPVITDKQVEESAKESDEDFESASQYRPKPVEKIRRKRRRIDLEDTQDITANPSVFPKLDINKMFGKKAQEKYNAQKKNAECKIYPPAAIPDNNNPQTKKAAPKRFPKKRQKRKSKTNECNIYNVSGLSQGVSPFSTPQKADMQLENAELNKDEKEPEPTSQNAEQKICHIVQAKHINVKNIVEERLCVEEENLNPDESKPSKKVEIYGWDDERSVNPSNQSVQKTKEVDTTKKDKFTRSLRRTSECKKAKKNVDDIATALSKTADPLKSQLLNVQNCETQESTPQQITEPFTINADIHHNCNSYNTTQENAKLPQLLKSPTARLIKDKCPETPVLAELKDMPIVCVGETQEKSAPYFVTTPNSGNKQERLLVERPEPLPARPTVELGLLDFSGPSQETTKSFDQSTVEPDKILQTCRMVLSNLDTSHTKQTETTMTSETNKPPTPNDCITTCPLGFVGRVVDISKDVAKRPSKDLASKTMQEVNAVLSQLSKDGSPNKVDETNSAVVEEDQGLMSPLFSSNAFPVSSATDSSHISTCKTNSVKTSEEMEPEQTKVNLKVKTTATKRRKKSSRITMPPKKPRIRIVDATKTSPTKKTNTKSKPGNNIIADKECKDQARNEKQISAMETSAVTKPLDAEKKTNLQSEDLEDSETKMVCTSNGWGGTKLKIRIFRKGSQDCDTEEKVSSPKEATEMEKSLLTPSQADSENKQPCNKVTVCFKNSESPLSQSSRKDKSQDSSVLIVDSLKVKSKTLKSSKKVAAAERQSPRKRPLKKRYEAPPSPTLSQRSYKISSSWPQTLAQKRAMVVLDKMDVNIFNFHSTPAKQKVKEGNRPKPMQDESENVIPNSPLMFAQSQQGNGSPTKIGTGSDLDENEVVCQSWSERPEEATSCHDDKSIMGHELIGEEKSVAEKLAPEITDNRRLTEFSKVNNVATEDSQVHDFDESFELISKAANRMQRIVELRKAFTKHSHLVERLRHLSKKILEFLPFDGQHPLDGSTESSPVQCKAKRRVRKLSDCSEDDILVNQEPDESEVEIESSLPSIMPAMRKRNPTSLRTTKPADTAQPESHTPSKGGENLKSHCPDVTMEMSEDLSVITSTSKPQSKQPESRLIVDETEMHETNTMCHQDEGDILNAHISCIAPPETNCRKMDHSQGLNNNEDPNEIGDSPQSPISSNDPSEFEDVVGEIPPQEGSINNDDDDAKHCTPPESSQVGAITRSQIPSLTPPPHEEANFSDLSNVTDLLQKISDFTEDLRQSGSEKDLKCPKTEVSVVENTPHSSQTFVTCQESMVTQSPPVCVSQSKSHTSQLQQNSQEKTKSVEVLKEETKENSPRRNVMEPIHKDTTPLADRSRILSPQNSGVNNTSNNDSILSATSSLAGVSSHRKMGIMTSGIRGKALEVVKRFAKKCSSTFHDSFLQGDVTHVIVKTDQLRCDRTLKFLQGIASKIWVVSLSWVVDSMRRKKVMNEESYEVVGDNIDQESTALYAPKRSRLSDPSFKLLKDFVVCCQPPFALFTADQFVEILGLCGASTVSSPEEFLRYNRDKQRIITMDASAYSDSLPDYSAYALTYHATAVSCEWVLESIATFTVQPTRGFPVEDSESQAMAQL